MEQEFMKKQNYRQFLRYILPSIVTMVFLSFYTTIDGFFVSRFVSSEALAAINIVIPITCVMFGIAVMLATGSGALVGIKLGEKENDAANGFFSFVTLVLLGIGILLTIIGIIFLEPILIFLGSTEKLLPYTKSYGFVTMLMTLPMMFKLYFEYYARADGNPKLSLHMSTVGLVLNIAFDYIFIVVLKMGILGAALGTFLAITISALMGLFYFLKRGICLKFVKPLCDFNALWNACYNGCSEMFTEFSTGITTFLFNISILAFYGENGIAGMSIIMYIYYFFIAVYFGITVGICPMISYNYGAKNTDKIQECLKHSFITIAWSSIVVFLVSFLGGKYIIEFFTKDPEVYTLTVEGLKLFSLTFIIIGVNVFMSGYFTAINKGTISAIISISRSLVFVAIFVVILPRFMGVNGIWLSMPFSEFLSVFISIPFYLRIGKKEVTFS